MGRWSIQIGAPFQSAKGKGMQSGKAQTSSGKVVAIGALMVDLLCRVDNLPQAGEGVVVTSSHMTLGGCAFNSAEVLRQLGISCELLAPTGQGMFATMAQEQLTQRGIALWQPEGVASDNLFCEPKDSPNDFSTPPYDCGACICFVTPDGQRTMVTLPGVERHFQSAWFEQAPAKEVSLAFCSGYEIDGAGGHAILSYLSRIRHDSPDATIIYAAGPRIAAVSREKTAQLLSLDAVWHINDQEALAYSGCETKASAGTTIAQATHNTDVVTAGSLGAYGFEPVCGNESETTHSHVSTTPVVVADTVGAGDAHLGAMIAAYMCGMNWVDAACFANKISAAVCQSIGATVTDEKLAIFRQLLHEKQQ